MRTEEMYVGARGNVDMYAQSQTPRKLKMIPCSGVETGFPIILEFSTRTTAENIAGPCRRRKQKKTALYPP